jgi:hypothetical protein
MGGGGVRPASPIACASEAVWLAEQPDKAAALPAHSMSSHPSSAGELA